MNCCAKCRSSSITQIVGLSDPENRDFSFCCHQSVLFLSPSLPVSFLGFFQLEVTASGGGQLCLCPAQEYQLFGFLTASTAFHVPGESSFFVCAIEKAVHKSHENTSLTACIFWFSKVDEARGIRRLSFPSEKRKKGSWNV